MHRDSHREVRKGTGMHSGLQLPNTGLMVKDDVVNVEAVIRGRLKWMMMMMMIVFMMYGR